MKLAKDNFLEMLQIPAGGTSSLSNINDKVSCASLLDGMEKDLAHQKTVINTCTHLPPFLDTVLEILCLRIQVVQGNDDKGFNHLF